MKLIAKPEHSPVLPNLERAARCPGDLPELWEHPGVTHEQRETLVREVFRAITFDGKNFITVEPNPAYIPLFAAVVTNQKLGICALKPTPSPPIDRTRFT
jgi:F0F1-type ATP synthase delta subunit